MATSHPTLRNFLRLPRPKSPAHIFLGNEASDLDSVASALGCAYLSNTTPPSTPVINILRTDLRLRRDVLYVLTLTNLTSEDLTFIDDMPSPTTLTLVDHNVLASHQSHFAGIVTAIVDHHADEHQFPSAHPRVVAPTGSCATLVSEIGEPDVDTARLLLCAILLDCGNMEPGGKGTPRDIEAVERLSRIAGWRHRERASVYAKLKAARKDISGFSVTDLLRKDMKVVEVAVKKVAMCTVTISAWDLAAHRERLKDVVEDFREQLRVDCVVIMNSYAGSSGHRREICVLKNKLGEALAEKLVCEAILRLREINVEGGEDLLCFSQGNAKASRKVVAPIMKQVLGDLESLQR